MQWLVTNFGTGAEKFGQANHSVASMNTVATLLKVYSAPTSNYTRGAWYAAAALITDYFVRIIASIHSSLSMINGDHGVHWLVATDGLPDASSSAVAVCRSCPGSQLDVLVPLS